MHDQFLPNPIEANRDRFAKTKNFKLPTCYICQTKRIWNYSFV